MAPQWTEQSRTRALTWGRICLPPILWLVREEMIEGGLPSTDKNGNPYILIHWPLMDEDHTWKAYLKELRLLIREGKLDVIFYEGKGFVNLVRKIFAGKYTVLSQKKSQAAWEQKYLLDEQNGGPDKRRRSDKWQAGRDTRGSRWVTVSCQKMQKRSDKARLVTENKSSKAEALQEPSTLPAHHCDRLMAELEQKGTSVLEEDGLGPVKLSPPAGDDAYQDASMNVEEHDPRLGLAQGAIPQSRPPTRPRHASGSCSTSVFRASRSKETQDKELSLTLIGSEMELDAQSVTEIVEEGISVGNAGDKEERLARTCINAVSGNTQAGHGISQISQAVDRRIQRAIADAERIRTDDRFLAGSRATQSHGRQVNQTLNNFQAPAARPSLLPDFSSPRIREELAKEQSKRQERPKHALPVMGQTRNMSQLSGAKDAPLPQVDGDLMELDIRTTQPEGPPASLELLPDGTCAGDLHEALTRAPPSSTRRNPQPEVPGCPVGRVPVSLTSEVYKGFDMEPPVVQLERINNFLSDDDRSRDPEWRYHISSVVDYLNWLAGTYPGEDFRGRLPEVQAKLQVHKIWEKYHFRPREIPKSFPDIWAAKRREIAGQQSLYKDEQIAATYNQPLAIDSEGHKIPERYMKRYLVHWEQDWRFKREDPPASVLRRSENMCWVQQDALIKYMARPIHPREMITPEKMIAILDEEAKFVFRVQDISLKDPGVLEPSLESRVAFARYRGTLLGFQAMLHEERISTDQRKFDGLRTRLAQLRPYPDFKPKNVPLGYQRNPARPGLFRRPAYPKYYLPGKGPKEAFTYIKQLGLMRGEEGMISDDVKQTVKSRHENQADNGTIDRVYPLPSLRGPRIPLELDQKGAEARELLTGARSILRILDLEGKRRPRQLITDMVAMYRAGLESSRRKDQAETLGLRFRDSEYQDNELQWLDLRELEHLAFLKGWPDPFGRRGFLAKSHKIFHKRVIKLLRDPFKDHFKGKGDEEGISLGELLGLVNGLAVGGVNKIKFRRDHIVVKHALGRLIIASMLKTTNGRYTRTHPKMYPEQRIIWAEDAKELAESREEDDEASGFDAELVVDLDDLRSEVSWTPSNIEEERIRSSMPENMEIIHWRVVDRTPDHPAVTNSMAETSNFYKCLAFRLGLTLKEDALPERHTSLTNLAMQCKASKRNDSREDMIREWLQGLEERNSPTYRHALSMAERRSRDDLDPRAAAMLFQEKLIEDLNNNHNSIWAPKVVNKDYDAENTFDREPLWAWAVPRCVRETKPMFWHLDAWPQQVDMMWEYKDIRYHNVPGGYRKPLKYTGFNLKEWVESRRFQMAILDAQTRLGPYNDGSGQKGDPHPEESAKKWAEVNPTPPKLRPEEGLATHEYYSKMPNERIRRLVERKEAEERNAQPGSRSAAGEKRKRVESDTTGGPSTSKHPRLSGNDRAQGSRTEIDLSLPHLPPQYMPTSKPANEFDADKVKAAQKPSLRDRMIGIFGFGRERYARGDEGDDQESDEEGGSQGGDNEEE